MTENPDLVAEQNARVKAIDRAETIRASLIDERRTLLTHIARQPRPTKLSLGRLRNVHDAVELLNRIIDAERMGD